MKGISGILPKSFSDTFYEFFKHFSFCVVSSMKCKTTNVHEGLNTEFQRKFAWQKCDKQKNEIIIFHKVSKIRTG